MVRSVTSGGSGRAAVASWPGQDGVVRQAVVAAERAANLQPDDVDAAVLLARTLRAKGDLPRARRELESQIRRQPQAALLRLELGWTCLQQQDVRSARSAFDAALDLDPDKFGLSFGTLPFGGMMVARTASTPKVPLPCRRMASQPAPGAKPANASRRSRALSGSTVI